MQVELTTKDIENILSLINTSSFKGDSIEMVYDLKEKFKNALEEDGKRDTSNICD